MSKLKIALVIVTAVLLFGGLGAAYYFTNVRPKQASPSAASTGGGRIVDFTKQAASGTPKPQVKNYADASGFSFNYPESLSVSDITPNDTVSYSILSLKDSTGEVKITVADTKSNSIETWLASDKTAPKGATLVGSINLGTLPAKQYLLSGELYTVAIDQGVLYLVTGPADNGFWQNAQSTIISSFALTPAATPASAASSGSSNTIYEEEVVVE